MALPTGTVEIVADPSLCETDAGGYVLSVTGSDGATYPQPVAADRYRLVRRDDGRWVFRPGPTSALDLGLIPRGGWSACVVAYLAPNDPAAYRRLVTARSSHLDRAWGLVTQIAAVRVKQRQADATYDDFPFAYPESFDPVSLLAGGYDPTTGELWAARGSHPDEARPTQPPYDYEIPGDHRLYLGGDGEGWGPPDHDVMAVVYTPGRLTRDDRVSLLARYGLPDHRVPVAGPGVWSRGVAVDDDTLTLALRPVAGGESLAGEVEATLTRPPTATTTATSGRLLVDGYTDPVEVGTRTGPDGWWQRVWRFDTAAYPDGERAIALGVNTAENHCRGLVEDWLVVTGAGVPTLPHLDATTGRVRHTFDPIRSVIYLGLYAFDPAALADDAYGPAVRAAAEAAGLCPETGPVIGGLIRDYASVDEWWATGDYQRSVQGAALARWGGGFGVGLDDWWWDYTGGPGWPRYTRYSAIRLMHDRGWTREVCERLVGWTREVGRPLFCNYKDEFQYVVGIDPDDATAYGLHPDTGLGGPAPVAGLVAEWRRAGGCAIGPGSVIVTADTPVGWNRWDRPEYTDFVHQYHDAHLYGAYPFITNPSFATTLGWAARHRDPARLFAANASVIMEAGISVGGGVVRRPPATEYLRGGAYRPGQVGCQIWLALRYGATAVRMYRPESLYIRQLNENSPVGTFVQRGIYPGHPAWDELLVHGRAIRALTPYLLMPEAPAPDLGRDWAAFVRVGGGRKLLAAVNATDGVRRAPAALDVSGYDAAVILHTTRADVAPAAVPGRVVPPGGVVALLGG